MAIISFLFTLLVGVFLVTCGVYLLTSYKRGIPADKADKFLAIYWILLSTVVFYAAFRDAPFHIV